MQMYSYGKMLLILIGYLMLIENIALFYKMLLILIGYLMLIENIALFYKIDKRPKIKSQWSTKYIYIYIYVYSIAPLSTVNTFQELPRLRETADNAERYI
jgi:hypothetical protein